MALRAGVPVADLCRKHGVSDASIYKWKSKFGGMDVSEAKRLRSLEDENTKLKRLLADAMLDNAALKDLLGKKWLRPRGSGKLSLIWWMPTGWANGGRVKPSAAAA